MKKIITVKEFSEVLKKRINEEKGIDCCKEEITNLANLAAKMIGDTEIEVNWIED